jgi:tellurite resistance protein TehA-like permease
MIAVYLCRLMFFGMPPAMANNSIWVILGPIGQGANAILRLGRNAQRMGAMGYFCAGSAACATATPMSSFADSFPGVSLLIGMNPTPFCSSALLSNRRFAYGL